MYENLESFGGEDLEQPSGDEQQMGVLQSEIKISLHTKHALTLWSGKQQSEKNTYGQIGVPHFAKTTAIIEKAIREDDPYADQVYYNLHNEIELAREELAEKNKVFSEWLGAKVPGQMRMTVSTSVNPVVKPLAFNSKLAFQLAFWLVDFDNYARKMCLASHVGLVTGAQCNANLHEEMRRFRRTLNIVKEFFYTSVTRNDVAANNQRAINASEKHTRLVLTDEVLRMEKRSALAPAIASRPEEVSEVTPPEKLTKEVTEGDGTTAAA